MSATQSEDISVLEEAIDHNNAIDYIIERTSELVIKEQSVDFGKLRSLTLLSSRLENFESYCSIIVLSVAKNLGLTKAFTVEADENKDAYRMFNAMNLNDNTVNGMFVEMISALVPELITAVSTIIADIASRLARENVTRYTADRLARIEASINAKINQGTFENTNLSSRYEEIRARRNTDKENIEPGSKDHKGKRKGSFSFALGSYMDKSLGGTHQRKAIKSKKDNNKSSSSKSRSTENELLLGVTNIKIGSSRKDKSNNESASETSERLARKIKKERRAVPDLDDNIVPPSALKRKENTRKVDFEAVTDVSL